jgi:hypothetical protein
LDESLDYSNKQSVDERILRAWLCRTAVRHTPQIKCGNVSVLDKDRLPACTPERSSLRLSALHSAMLGTLIKLYRLPFVDLLLDRTRAECATNRNFAGTIHSGAKTYKLIR